jgi:hypothetical protein
MGAAAAPRARTVFVICRKEGKVSVWLTTQVPVRWGLRERAMNFKTKGDARRAASTLKIAAGSWTIELAERPSVLDSEGEDNAPAAQ